MRDFEITTPSMTLNLTTTTKNELAETADHILDWLGSLTRSMSSTNAEGVSLSKGVRGYSPLENSEIESFRITSFFPAHCT